MTYTKHGHHIPGSPVSEDPPNVTIYCGGTILCQACQDDATQYEIGDNFEVLSLDEVFESERPKPKAPENPRSHIQTEVYERIPFRVEAIQVTDENFEDVAAWCGGSIVTVHEAPRPAMPQAKRYIQVNVARPLSRRQTEAYVGDWILYAAKGYKVYSNRPFLKNFRNVEGDAVELFVTDEVVDHG